MNLLVALARTRWLQPLWTRLHRLTLIGMNFWSSELEVTGERDALRFVADRLKTVSHPVLFDVGANAGDFTRALLDTFDDHCQIHSFEPSAATFGMLQRNLAAKSAVSLHRLGFSDREGEATLHSSEVGSTIASLVDLDRPVRPFDAALDENVAITTIDRFCEGRNISVIDFLKLDIEGHELAALRGARRMIEDGRIHCIQFEFGENNVGARTFMSDFVKLLSGFDFYRIVPGGPVPWHYQGGASEIFATMNYLCVRR